MQWIPSSKLITTSKSTPYWPVRSKNDGIGMGRGMGWEKEKQAEGGHTGKKIRVL